MTSAWRHRLFVYGITIPFAVIRKGTRAFSSWPGVHSIKKAGYISADQSGITQPIAVADQRRTIHWGSVRLGPRKRVHSWAGEDPASRSPSRPTRASEAMVFIDALTALTGVRAPLLQSHHTDTKP